mgnify:CR=1 FL=1
MRFLIAISIAFLLAGILPACAKKSSVTDSPDEHDQSYKPPFAVPLDGVSFHAIPKGEYELKSIQYFFDYRHGAKEKLLISLSHDLEAPADRSGDQIQQIRLEHPNKGEKMFRTDMVALRKIVSDGATAISKGPELFSYEVSVDGTTKLDVAGPDTEADAIELITKALPLTDKGVYLSDETLKDLHPNGAVERRINKMVVKVNGDSLTIYHVQIQMVNGEFEESNLLMTASTYVRIP